VPAVLITFTQEAFRGRNDDGSEIAATWKAAKDVVWSQPVNTNFRLRVVVSKLSEPIASNGSMGLWVSHNEGSFVLCDADTGTSPVQNVASSIGGYNHADDTTQQVGSAGTYLSNNQGVVEQADNDARSETATWAGSTAQEGEFEYTLRIIGSKVSPGDTLEFRVRFLGIIFVGGYSSVPILVVPELARLKIKGGTVLIKGGTLKLK
jgi:hypothetical protein